MSTEFSFGDVGGLLRVDKLEGGVNGFSRVSTFAGMRVGEWWGEWSASKVDSFSLWEKGSW